MTFKEPKIRIGSKTMTQADIQEQRQRTAQRYNAQVRHGVDSKYTKFYQSTNWRKKRKQILLRDNYMCQECVKYGTISTDNLIVHHKKEIKKDWENRLKESNLVTICTACHNRLDHLPHRKSSYLQ
ncbi:HNH endonuclease [Staphylococcus xylosus]